MFAGALGTLVAGLVSLAIAAPAAAGTARDLVTGKDRHYAPVYGRTLPPIGFVDFCARNKKQCEPLGSSRHATLTKSRWATLREVNAYVNSSIEPVSDQDLYA